MPMPMKSRNGGDIVKFANKILDTRKLACDNRTAYAFGEEKSLSSAISANV